MAHTQMDTLKITLETRPKDILDRVAVLREKKGREKDVLNLIDQALKFGHDWVINLFWEEALTWQHVVMNENLNPNGADKIKKSTALLQMQKSILKSKVLY